MKNEDNKKNNEDKKMSKITQDKERRTKITRERRSYERRTNIKRK